MHAKRRLDIVSALGLAGTAALATFAKAASDCAPLPPVSLYARGDSLVSTLTAARGTLATWRADQAAARSAVQWGAWHVTDLLPFDAAPPAFDPTGKGVNGSPVWTPQPKWKPASIIPLVPAGEGRRPSSIVLAGSLTAAKAVRLTVGLGGGDRMEVWLGGKPVADAATRMNFGRYGCGQSSDRIFPDQCMIDLDLPAGKTPIVVRLSQNEINRHTPFRFWYSPSPNPIPHLWQRVRMDFPPRDHPLLAAVPHTWFANDGWLASADAAFEREFLASVIERQPAIRAALEARRDALLARDGGDGAGWLDLCDAAAQADRALSDLAKLEPAIAELSRGFGDRYPSEPHTARIAALRGDVQAALQAPDGDGGGLAAIRASVDALKRAALVETNPLLKDAKLLFSRRHTYNSRHYYDDYYAGLHTFGGNLREVDLATGATRDVAPELGNGIFDRYDISPDGSKVVFGWRAPRPEGFRIWESNLDGTGLRQLTVPPDDEAERIARHSYLPAATLEANPHLYGHWTDDMHPCYLPDGRIVFVSSRPERTVLCGGHSLTCTALYRIDPDGSNLRELSQGALTESTPTVLDDGRILYTRWEYVYKGIGAVQSMWAMRPDGTASEEVYGHNIDNPGVFFAGRQVPGRPNLVVAAGVGHEPLAVGSIVLVDRSNDRRSKDAMTRLTPETETRGLRGFYQFRNGTWSEHDIFGPFYTDPYPLADPETHAGAGSFFLVSHTPDARYNDPGAYGVWLIDVHGNRVPVHEDPEMSCFQPMVLARRPAALVLPAMADESKEDGEASVLLVDLYRNLPGVEPGAVKYLRVMEQIPRSWIASQIQPGDAIRGQQPAVSMATHIWIGVLLGIVPVEDDGSALFKVPARRNVYFNALDENFMEVQKMRTFVNFQPGETRSCVGCHDPRDGTPAPGHPMAMLKPAVAIGPQPGDNGPRPIHYPTDVQPVLDRHCVRCHDVENPKGGLDLSGTLTTHFSASYENLLRTGLVPFIQEWTAPEPNQAGPYHVANGSMLFVEAAPPYTFGSHTSRLIEKVRAGHAKVELEREEFVRLVTWVDANAPFYGSYFGRRHISAKGRPGFRAMPTLASARGIPPPPFAQPPLPAELLAAWTVGSTAGLPDRFNGATFVRGEAVGVHEAVSVALWVRADELKNRWSPILFTDGSETSALHFSILNDGTPNVAINSGGKHWVHASAGAALTPGRWHHLALVCDPRFEGEARFYIDGKPSGGKKLDLGIPLALDAFRIGAWSSWEKTPANNFHGSMADLRLYRGLLTVDEITALASRAPAPAVASIRN